MRRFVPTLILAILAAGCGPDEAPPPIITGDPANNGQSNNGQTSTTGTNNTVGVTNNQTSGSDAMCVGVMCDPGRKCVRGTCVLESLQVACQDGTDLGVIDLSETLRVSGDTQGWADSLSLTCADDSGFSGAENAFHFTVPAAARVNLDLTSAAGIDWATEVRVDSCDDATATLVCEDAEQLSFLAEPGRDYWIIVEPKTGIDEGAFDLSLEFAELVCSPPGGRSCVGDNLAVCQAGLSKPQYACGTGCADSACLGDTCDTAHVITASASFSGDTNGFGNALNFRDQPSCSGSGVQGLDTPGPEVVLLLQGMVAGAVITIDASMNDENDNAILVQQTCGASSACLAGSDVGDMLEFTVPQAGDYYVIIDKLTSSAKPFFYSVDIP